MSTINIHEEEYIAWFNNAKDNENLIDIKFHVGDLHESDHEDFYKEANYFNQQLDKKDISARIDVQL